MRIPAFTLAVVLSLAAALPAAAASVSGSDLDAGYRDLYNLQFDEAHRAFAQWQQGNPQDPMGPASDAAAWLFAEFNRLHILESEFFTDDRNFENQKKLSPDPRAKAAFDAALDRARKLAEAALARNPADRNALFASALTFGLRGDYAALIEKRNLAGLGYVKQARARAQRLIAEDPSYGDAYLAIGVENYLLSLKPAPLRWLLRLDGAETDKAMGLENLRRTADTGHYLAPYARLLLAVAALRDHDRDRARDLLEGLVREFPRNPLYLRELALLR